MEGRRRNVGGREAAVKEELSKEYMKPATAINKTRKWRREKKIIG